MKVLQTSLAGVLLIEPRVAADSRGFFVETFSRKRYAPAGIADEFVQDNHSRSAVGTIRGLHYQDHPGQAKLVRVARGRILDAVVDLRRTSATFGEHETFELDDSLHRQLYIPVGFAHGFCVLSLLADVVYRVSSYYDANAEHGVAWNDPALGIRWPASEPIMSERDQLLPRLGDADLPDW